MEINKLQFDKEILSLRSQIDKIDCQILSLLAKRQGQVEEVVKLKKTHHIPVYHPAREEDLISKIRAQACKANLDPDFMEDLYRLILRQSRVNQIDQMEGKGVRPDTRILIIGGDGQMGGFFASLFHKSGYEVRILGKNDWNKAKQLCENIELCLICVPIEKTNDIIEEIAPFLEPNTILADLTSIKDEPLKKMLDAHPGPVTGLHPLFGPDSGSLDKQIVVVTPGRESDSCRWLVDQMTLWGAVIVPASAKEHDEIMEIVQALRHFATFSFGQFLYEKHARLERTLEFSSPIYRLEFGMVGRLFAQDASLYSEIIFATKKRRQLLKDYIASLSDHLEMLESNNKNLFIEKFDHIAKWFGPFSEQAMRESTFLINKLIERF
ncbi:MAG: bifunctional chorismate mutase/prephenate dehydrogenase [Desulfobacula sp.]|jgi:chorismate mutase/prephenate dehydrogenase|uniref:bifunctional chorismate mutase/prephenate dehydrogenase n=1 Tax=Desulfobacula sp. TaxID=2593537 RepID=UPI001D694A73|nr:bifunctional chorismate mutase/prephenate dehydrogenase [Desulfobacula sp.]MBT3486533.1 bifunctional chorismate mutase/prephenate dehydrogenase [Desulfobacula sp.]MBT3805319.1 bifunctional chorismate mutase/prephenate dehydrogenase [Desulfobacula sp.]MBT4025671.1 bifunctional chorismate mutase/prephenate dehydrogenase [Desulfobacula sp.]MBT4197516.1 bifunctional chorismate mutase/prephenate dehydrogenase [Desulfobacula sp.]